MKDLENHVEDSERAAGALSSTPYCEKVSALTKELEVDWGDKETIDGCNVVFGQIWDGYVVASLDSPKFLYYGLDKPQCRELVTESLKFYRNTKESANV